MERWCEEGGVTEAYGRHVDLLRERRLADDGFLKWHAYDLMGGKAFFERDEPVSLESEAIAETF